MERVADYVIRTIADAGAAHIFMVTGRGILQLTDAVAKCPDIHGISTLHEQGASYAAMAYAKATGNLGACLVSTGCAAANAVAGCLCAYQDNLPVVFISGNHSLAETTRYTGVPIRTYGSQETDIVSIVEPITKYAVMLVNLSDVAYEVQKALYIAQEGRKGPVWIDIPLDIQGMRIESDSLRRFDSPEKDFIETDRAIQETIEELQNAERPILLIGGGSRGCSNLIKNLAEHFGIPVVYTFSACDIYGSGNRLSIGAVGSLGAPRAGNFTLQNADYVLAVGSKLCSQSIGGFPEKVVREARVTVVDVDKNEHGKNGIKIDRFICSDASEFLVELIKRMEALHTADWIEKCLHWKEIFSVTKEKFITAENDERIDLYTFANTLSNKLKDDTVVITDAGLEELIIPSTISYRKNQKCFFPASQGAMGYAIPAIMGAWFGGCKDILAVVGDGSVMMNIQELLLLKYHGIPAKICVINNNMYAVIRSRQKDLFRTRTIGNDPSDGVPMPDFEKLAVAFGLKYQRINDDTELEKGLDDLMEAKEPVLCEVFSKEDQKYFHTSFRRGMHGALVRPPIEDQSPYMERDLFLSEMIVPPVDL